MGSQIASNLTPSASHEPLFDVHPRTGASIEVFYADRALETFGKCGSGWFWWPRWPGFAPAGAATGPFATSYAAYRHALQADDQDTAGERPITLACLPDAYLAAEERCHNKLSH